MSTDSKSSSPYTTFPRISTQVLKILAGGGTCWKEGA